MARQSRATALLISLLTLSALCSAQQFWSLTWSNTNLLGMTIAEPLVVSGFKSFFNTSDVYALDVRQRNGTVLPPMTGSSSTFQTLLLVGNPSNISNSTSTAVASHSNSSAALVMALLAEMSAATNITMAFLLQNVNLSAISSQTALLYAPFVCLTAIPVPTNGTNFMIARVVFRNLASVSSLTQSLIYQTRLGMARFLDLPSVRRVVPTSPATTSSANVLRIVQSFYIILGNDSNVTLAQREVLANLLIYGDPSRPIVDDEDSSPRPSMFLDYIFTPPEGYLEGSESYGSVILSFLFSSITVEQFPTGNPPAPALTPPPGTVVPATPNSVMVAMQRKRQRFLYDISVQDSVIPVASTSVIADLTSVLTNITACTTGSDGYCTYIYWTNTLKRTFWVERMESVERVGWNMFPGTTFFASDDPAPSFLGPLIQPGNDSTPLWTLGALSGASNRLDFALYLRNVDDNATLLHVEIATDIRSKAQATSTVTSIARDTSGSSLSIYETKSNLAISYQSLYRNSNQMILMMKIHESNATTKDTSQPCAHCQNVYDWCQQHSACAALSSCVFQAGVDAAQIPNTMLTSGNLQDVTPDLWPYFQRCMAPIANDTNATALNLDGLLILSSAVRCQMQRVCAFRTDTNATTTAGTDSTNDGSTRILVWESGEASQQIHLPGNMSATIPSTTVFNVSVQLGARVLCYLPIQVNTTTSVMEDWLKRSCHLAKYFGRVTVTVTNRTDDFVLYAMYTNDCATIRYKNLAGPLPVLELVSVTNSTSNITNITSANQLVINSTMPSIRLRLATKAMLDSRYAFPVINASAPPDPCTTTCRTLALDVCMRDSQCVAFTDCISRYPSASGGSMSDAILNLFQQPTTSIDESSLSFSAAIDSCHSVDMVNDVSWRKLLDASACYSRNACPISLDWLIPLSKRLVGQWQLEPTAGVQMLMYEADAASSEGDDSDVQIPLVLMRDGEIVRNMTSGIDDTLELQANLRDLLSYEYINVSLEYDSALLSPTSPRSMTWRIEYDYWLGSLPRFLSSDSYPPWTLFTSQTQDAVLSITANASSMANSTSGDLASVSVSATSTSST